MPDQAISATESRWNINLVVCSLGSFTTLVAMTLLLPFLPVYVQELGVKDHAAIAEWSGFAYGATFLTAGLTAPLWGRLADRYGRKLMLIRASLGMAIAMSLIGMAHNVYELVGLRLLAGLLGGYASGSMALIAAQTPKERSGWALGIVATGTMAGNLAGPLIGGSLPPIIGIRATFLASGAMIFLTFLATTFLIREERQAPKTRKPGGQWAQIPNKGAVGLMLFTGFLLMLANMSIEPIITLYVAKLVPTQHVIFVAGLVMAAAAAGSVISSSRLGHLADRIGHRRIIVYGLAAAGLLLIPQAFVTDGWQLIALRFVMGLALGGLVPCIAAVIRHSVPQEMTSGALGYSISSQFAGQVLGPLGGGFIGGHIGMRAVFWITAVLMGVGALANWRNLRRSD